MAKNADFEHKIGDSFELTCTVTNPDTGLAEPITGWTIDCSSRSMNKRPQIDIVFTITVIDAVGGIFTITATPAETALWPKATKFLTDVTLTRPDDFVFSTRTFTFDVVENYP